VHHNLYQLGLIHKGELLLNICPVVRLTVGFNNISSLLLVHPDASLYVFLISLFSQFL
jgi:hypothetical protein